MPQDPNAWWSREIGDDLNRGVVENFKDMNDLNRGKGRKVALTIVLVLAAWSVVGYLFFVIIRHLWR
jgi:hypothetical protein